MPRILIVDDEQEFRKLLRAMLEKAGYDVLEAPDAPRGFVLYCENPIDLLIVHLVMPKVSGAALIHMLRYKFPDAKIIAISGGVATGNFVVLPAHSVLRAHRAFL